MGYAVIIIFGAFFWGAIASGIAEGKGNRGFAWGFFLGPLGVLITALSSPNQAVLERRQLDAGTTKRCPYCAEPIRMEAVACRYCGRDLPTSGPPVSEYAMLVELSRSYLIQHPSADGQADLGRLLRRKGVSSAMAQAAMADAARDLQIPLAVPPPSVQARVGARLGRGWPQSRRLWTVLYGVALLSCAAAAAWYVSSQSGEARATVGPTAQRPPDPTAASVIVGVFDGRLTVPGPGFIDARAMDATPGTPESYVPVWTSFSEVSEVCRLPGGASVTIEQLARFGDARYFRVNTGTCRGWVNDIFISSARHG